LELTHVTGWYALYTKSRAEKKVLDSLGKLGIEAYLPMHKVLRQWSDRKKWVEVPLINSYVFINLPSADCDLVYAIPGVVAYVSDKGKKALIPAHEIEIMRLAIENKMVLTIEKQNLEKGQTITITSGPLLGVKGEVLEHKGDKKLIIAMSQIGYKLVIDLNEVTYTIDTGHEA